MPTEDRTVLKRSDLETQSVATRVIKANRKAVAQSSLIVVLAVVISAVTSSLIIFTRPTHVKQDGASSALVDAAKQAGVGKVCHLHGREWT